MVSGPGWLSWPGRGCLVSRGPAARRPARTSFGRGSDTVVGRCVTSSVCEPRPRPRTVAGLGSAVGVTRAFEWALPGRRVFPGAELRVADFTPKRVGRIWFAFPLRPAGGDGLAPTRYPAVRVDPGTLLRPPIPDREYLRIVVISGEMAHPQCPCNSAGRWARAPDATARPAIPVPTKILA